MEENFPVCFMIIMDNVMRNSIVNFKKNFREREIDLIFENIKCKKFQNALELGSGSGHQIKPLSYYCESLIATEYETRFNFDELSAFKSPSISFQQCDAEKVGEVFQDNQFDLVFSSNMMEHLPCPEASFSGIYKILNRDGLSVCTMPSPFMKILYILLFYPAIIHSKFTRVRGLRSYKSSNSVKKVGHNNNPKVSFKKNSFSKYFPVPHGVSKDNFSEFFYWKKKQWIKKIESNGFSVVKVIKLPVTTGYAFKLESVCGFLYKLGFCSSYAYIAKKNDKSAVSNNSID
jgi:SAM-dependent methyltransferase